jgi:hypothetical protein
MSGPGGFYNIGNLIGLCQGLATQILVTKDLSQTSRMVSPATAVDYLAGNSAAIAMTAATTIFMVSGEVYHRAWNGQQQPRDDLNHLADFLSGLGAVCLGLALLAFGHPFLALTSGLLHSIGKFGSAWHGPGVPALKRPARRPDPFRTLVLFSRLPAIAAAGLELHASLFMGEAGMGGAGPVPHWTTPATLLVCYLLWSRADLLLFRSSRPKGARDRIPT